MLLISLCDIEFSTNLVRDFITDFIPECMSIHIDIIAVLTYCRIYLATGVSKLIQVSGLPIMVMDKDTMPMHMVQLKIHHYMHIVHTLVMPSILNRQVFQHQFTILSNKIYSFSPFLGFMKFMFRVIFVILLVEDFLFVFSHFPSIPLLSYLNFTYLVMSIGFLK